MLLFLLLVMPRSDPSSFSGPPGKALILDPGISLSLCLLISFYFVDRVCTCFV